MTMAELVSALCSVLSAQHVPEGIDDAASAE